MTSKRHRNGNRKNKHRNHRPLWWYLQQYGANGKAIYERKG